MSTSTHNPIHKANDPTHDPAFLAALPADARDRTELERMLTGQPYLASDPLIRALAARQRKKLRELNDELDDGRRAELFAAFFDFSDSEDIVGVGEKTAGAGTGEGEEEEGKGKGKGERTNGDKDEEGGRKRVPREVGIVSPFFCEYGFNITLGNDVMFNAGCTILDVCPVTIGSRTLFGPSVQIYTATHPLSPAARNGTKGRESARPISIGNDCWIGGGAIILPGVTIGDCAIVGAGCVVTKDVPRGCVVAGNPGRVVKEGLDKL